jgi:hypothetical protein
MAMTTDHAACDPGDQAASECQFSTKPAGAKPRGFWRMPKEIWDDDRVMDSFLEQIVTHMDEVARRSERD